MDDILCLYNRPTNLSKFKVVGFIPSSEFHYCVYIVNKLYACYPEVYEKPEIRAMLNVDWDEYLTKMKRRFGKAYYLLKSPVAVYLDGGLIGDDIALQDLVKEKYFLQTTINFQEVAEKEIINYFLDITDKHKRKFVYLTIAIDERVVGSMLFMLYNDLVPATCENFLNRCTTTSPDHSYKSTNMHRIAKYSWVQCGGWDLCHVHMACENYAVPHDRRGVLSMCNKGRHQKNSTQFFITLNPSSWMDYNFVAFGQLIQGAEILNLIERVPTYYENPNRKIQITKCGEFSVCPTPDEDYVKAVNPPFESLFAEVVGDDDIDSVLSETGFRSGKYFLKTDMKSYIPFMRYSRMFDEYIRHLDEQDLENLDDVRIEKTLKSIKEQPIEQQEQERQQYHEPVDIPFFRSSRVFYYRK